MIISFGAGSEVGIEDPETNVSLSWQITLKDAGTGILAMLQASCPGFYGVNSKTTPSP
jgi:hypothetical protein